MSDEQRHRPSRARVVGVPADLLLVSAGSVVASLVIQVTTDFSQVVEPGGASLAAVASATVGAFAALALVLFLSGYAIVAALFPNRPSSEQLVTASTTRSSLGRAERLALSFGLSVATLPLIGVVITVTPLTFATVTVAALVTAIVLASAGVAMLRGHAAPFARGTAGVGALVAGALGADRESNVDLAIAVVLAASIVLTVGTLAVTLTVPVQGEAYTGFSVLAPTGDGLTAAASYPTTLREDEAAPVVLVIENHERTSETYTVVVDQQRVDLRESSVVVLDAREQVRRRLEVGPGESARVRVDLAPTMTGPDTRFGFFLYRGAAPADAGSDTAYRHLYLWVDTVAPSDRTSPA